MMRLRRSTTMATLAIGVCGFVCDSGPGLPLLAQENAATRTVPAKELPVPTTVSPELATAISQPIWKLQSPKSVDEWRKVCRAMDMEQAEEAKKLATAVGATVKETTVGGVKCYTVTPREVLERNKNRLLVHVHGGAYVLGGGLACTSEAVRVATACKTNVLSVDYRMPPDNPFPAAVDDAVAVWIAVIKDRDPANFALFGTSTGGGLTMATVLKLKELKQPLPGALFLGTPWTDLTKTGDTYVTNAEVDNVLGRYEGFLEDAAKLYAGKTNLKNPLVSPVYGDMAGVPPTILISGTRDLFLSNTVRTHQKLRAAGVMADLHVYEGQSHGDYLIRLPFPEGEDALREIARFFDAHLKK